MSELIGLEEKKKDIIRAYRENKLNHALLFTGMEGIGKKKLAVDIASSILCENDSQKKLFDAGTMPDYLMITDNKMITVDQAQEIARFASERPLYSPRKVLIIDDAHKLNEHAQNKLLKTLETLPAFLYVMMITHLPGRLKDTVHSRLVEYSFSPLSKQDIFNALDEKYPLEERKKAAALSMGSLKMALELLENERVSRFVDLPEKIFSLIAQKNTLGTIQYVSENVQEDEMEQLLNFLFVWLRDLAVSTVDKQQLYYAHACEQLFAQRQVFGPKRLSLIHEELKKVKDRIEANINAYAAFDAAVLTITSEK